MYSSHPGRLRNAARQYATSGSRHGRTHFHGTLSASNALRESEMARRKAEIKKIKEVFLMPNALMIPLECMVCGGDTRDAISRGNDVMVPVCSHHLEGHETQVA